MHKVLHSMSVAHNEKDFYAQLKCLSIVPTNLWLPKININAVVDAFAADQDYDVYDASSMFNVCNDDACRVDTALVLLAERSKKKPQTIHLVRMTEYNVEALIMVDTLLQFRDVSDGITDALCVGKHILHAFCVLDGETLKMYDIKCRQIARQILAQAERNAECTVCLESLKSEFTAIPFACGHVLCHACGMSSDLTSCPSCRETKRWKSLNYFKIINTS